ncbi:unnamed protein product [Paramecium sonneborni]|uniref:Uncharacterized protein n=1 Tax=Paramecium sonneborni TaxID=65129 RepID=A0A8S1RN57_9CILI|nr:unnamed protein product [Paramecium sonneborni]
MEKLLSLVVINKVIVYVNEQSLRLVKYTLHSKYQELVGGVKVGSGFREMIQQNGYKGDGQGQGSYLLSNGDSQHFHHSANTQGKAFKFQSSDILIIEVSIEQKYIKWSKQNSQDYLITEIDTLYPCVYIDNSKVKIKGIL